MLILHVEFKQKCIDSEVTKSQRNRRRQRRLQICQKIYMQSLENKYLMVDLFVQKLLNDHFESILANEFLSAYRQTEDDKCFRCQS